MRRGTPLKQKAVNSGTPQKAAVSGRGRTDDATPSTSPAQPRTLASQSARSPVSRLRATSAGSSNDSRNTERRKRGFASFLSPRPSPASSGSAAVPQRRQASGPTSAARASPSHPSGATPRPRTQSAQQKSSASGGSPGVSSRRRGSDTPALISAEAPHTSRATTTAEAAVRSGGPVESRHAVQRHGGSISPSRSEAASVPTTPAAVRSPAKLSSAAPHPRDGAARRGGHASPATFTAQVTATPADGVPSPLRTPPPRLVAPGPHGADHLDDFALGQVPRLGELPGPSSAGLAATPPGADEAASSQAMRRKSSVVSSEQASRSLLLGSSGTTHAPSPDSRRHTLEGGDGGGAPGVVLGVAAQASSAPAAASPRKKSDDSARPAGAAPVSSCSDAVVPPASDSHAVGTASTSRHTSKSPSVKTTASRSGATAPVLRGIREAGAAATAQRFGGVPAYATADDAATAGTPRTHPMSNRVAPSSTTTPPRPTAATSRAETPTPSGSPRSHGAGAGEVSKRQRGGTPRGKSAAAAAAAAASTTPATSDAAVAGGGPASPAKARQSALQSQRAAAMLSHMLSVVRPMAPVVHVRIRPVLPSIGEANNQRHVYLLDHENVMITGTRAGFNASATTRPLLSSAADYPASRRTDSGARGAAGASLRNGSSLLSPGTSSALLANGTVSGGGGGGWRGAKATSPPGPSVPLAAPLGGGAPPASSTGSAETLYGSTTARLHAAAESAANSTELAASGSQTAPQRRRLSPTAAPGFAKLQPLTFPGVSPPPGGGDHRRTASWLSQGSEEVLGGSRHSAASPSTSPHQLGLPPGGASATASRSSSIPRTAPRLAAFRALPDDVPASPTTTPRGLAGCVATFGNEPGGDGQAGRRRGSWAMQQSVSLSAMTAPGSRTATRKNSLVCGNAAVSPHKSGKVGRGGLPLSARGTFPNSVSVSATSMPTGKDVVRSPGVEELRRSPSPNRDFLSASNTFNGPSLTALSAPVPTAGGAEQHYSFEFVHDEEATQADVFEESVLRFADEALLAQNVAIICYGPTGSGKTYSMMGSQAQHQQASSPSSGGGARKPASRPADPPQPATGNASTAKATSAASGGKKTGTGRGRTGQPAKGGSSPRAGKEGSRRSSASDGKRRHSAEEAAVADGDAAETSAGPRDDGDGDDGASDDINWPQLGSSWQFGYTDRLAKGRSAPDSSRSGGAAEGDEKWRHAGAASPMSSATMAEMGILPRLVHTLLERRGEAITIRREAGREESARSGSTTNAAAAAAPQPPRAGGAKDAAAASKPTNLSLTLRELTFYGIELYMDELCDLLDPGKRPIQTVGDTGGLAALCQRINEARDYRINGSRGGASQVCVTAPRSGGGMAITSLADLRRAYRLAHGNRVTAKHAQNDTSSRSHAIFLLQLDFELAESRGSQAGSGNGGDGDGDADGETVQRVHSYVAMVDLAGCERVKQTKVEGAALREAQYINKSLSALSSVVLSLHRNNAHVPYRDSKLTRLLRPCLEGGRVLTLVHVAPCSSTETVNTLKFADQIRHTHIPTHALTPTSSKHRELLDVFADLIDPMQGLWEAQVRQAQQQLSRLCADVRLAYFSRAIGEISRRAATTTTTTQRGLSSVSMPSDAISDVSAITDPNDGASLSPGDASLEEGPPPLPEDATEAERRHYALQAVLHHLMGPIHHHQRTTMREALRAIRRRKEHKIETHRRQLQERIDRLEAAVQQLSAANERLAAENRTPLPRDPYALELNRQLREAGEQVGETAKEQAALSTLTAALRQRLVNQDTLEATVDEQLRKVQQRTAQALQTLSAAAAAHPPGVADATVSGAVSPREPTLPTGSPVPAAIAMETDDDPELRDIAHQQISLATELAALRLETACFDIGSGMWEGLWARAMRKEIMTALEVEAFAMERILLDRRALAVMMMDDDEDDGGDGDDGDAAAATAAPLRASLTQTPPRRPFPKAGGSSPARSHLSPAFASPSAAHDRTLAGSGASNGVADAGRQSSLSARLGTYLHSTAGTSAASSHPAVDGGEVSSGKASPQMSPLPSWRRERADLATTATSEVSEPRSSDGLRLRSTLTSRHGSPARGAQRGYEEAMPNPLSVLAVAHDEAMRSARGEGLEPGAVAVAGDQQPQEGMADPQAAFTPPSSPSRAEAAAAAPGAATATSVEPTAAAALAAALLPLTLSGTYGDEQSLQEAALQLLLRDGIPCEVCCMGASAHHVLQHYVLPGTADAPLAEESEAHVRGATTAAATAYTVKTPGAAEALPEALGGGDADADGQSVPHTPAAHDRPASLKAASCTTRVGRLRLVRMPRRPNCYVLEFVYTHHGVPLSPRLQAALSGRAEESLLSTPRRTNLEQMVDALPSVHGVAGRGGARSPAPLLKEHRLFAIPLYEPSLHLHLHVLEEGIRDATTPIAATRVAAEDSADAAPLRSTAAAPPPPPPPSSPLLCVARRREAGPQMVLEVRGLPYSASTRRAQVVAAGALAKEQRKHKTAVLKSTKQKLAGTGKLSKKNDAGVGGTADGATTYQHLQAELKSSTTKAAAAHGASADSASAPAAGASGWSDLVLAKRLGSGGELMLPSSCILSNKGCCSLVLRFPRPFSTPMTRTESVEAVVGALCGILRPALAEPEVRRSAFSSRSPSKRGGTTSRPRRSPSPGAAERGSAGGLRRRRRGSRSGSSMRDDGEEAARTDVITYAHVPYTMFAAETPAMEMIDAPAGAERSASSSGYALPSPARGGGAGGGRVLRSPSSHSASMARTDSLDTLANSGGGVLGLTLQSSCSPGHGQHARQHGHAALHGSAAVTDPYVAGQPLRSPHRAGSGSTATAAAAAAPVDQQSGATLQVQFHWVPTPPDVDPPRSAAAGGGGGNLHTMSEACAKGEAAERAATPRQRLAGAAGQRPSQRSDGALVSQQTRAALGLLAHLSNIFVDSQPQSPGDASPADTIGDGGAHGPRPRHHSSSSTSGGDSNAMAVAALLRQLDTYRQRIRRLFRQQLYDAEDVLGDEVQLGGAERGAYLRDVQAEVRAIIGAPVAAGGGAVPSLTGSPVRAGGGLGAAASTAAEYRALLEPEGGELAPDTHVTLPEARELCGAVVPWSIWQWAYRWSQVRRMLFTAGDGGAAASNGGGGGGATSPRGAKGRRESRHWDSAAVWLPVDARPPTSAALHDVTAAASASAPHSALAAHADPTSLSADLASSSSSASEGYVMEGDWLTEARYAARPKRVWLPDVLSPTVPSYLESCSSEYLA